MPAQLAFTAGFWGRAAVVCRAVENRAGPLVDQQLGPFMSRTQAHAFATRLNEGLELAPSEARQIAIGAMLRNARNALFNAMHYVVNAELAAGDLLAITAKLHGLHAALRESDSRRHGRVARVRESRTTAGETGRYGASLGGRMSQVGSKDRRIGGNPCLA